MKRHSKTTAEYIREGAKPSLNGNGKHGKPPKFAPASYPGDPEPEREAGEVEPEPLGVPLATVQAEEVHWLWAGRIPLGKLTIVDGDPGLGKSVLTMDLAARLSSGQSMPFDGTPVSPAGVIIMNAEDGLADTVRPRLEAAGADLARILSLGAIRIDNDERLIMLPEDVDHVRRAIKAMAARLVIIDPLMAWLGGDYNAHRDQDSRRALHPLSKLAEETGAAFLVVRHLNKNAGSNPLYRGGGSIGIIGAARSGLLVARDPDDRHRRILASTKCNLALAPVSLAYDMSLDQTGRLRVGWIRESAHTAESLLAASGDDEDREALQEATEILRAILGNGGDTQADTVIRQAKQAGVSERTLNRAKRLLRVASRRIGFGKDGKWFWYLPESSPEGDAP